MLAYYFKEAPTAPAKLERTLAWPVEWKQLGSVFNYAMFGIKSEPMRVDQRWDIERRIAFAFRTKTTLGGIGSALQTLVESLPPGILRAPDQTQINNRIRELQSEKAAVKRGALESFNLPDQYKITDSPITIKFDNKDFILQLAPTNAKPNLNYLNQKALERYLIYKGIGGESAKKMAELIVDFRDPDDDSLGAGTEGPYRVDDRFLIPPLNAPIVKFESLAYIPNFDAATISFLRQNFSLIGDDPRVNFKYADQGVIVAITDLRPEVVAQALEYEARKNDPLYKDTLEGLIGTEAEKIWRTNVTDDIKDDAPVDLVLQHNMVSIHAVYVPKQRQLADVFVD